MRYVLDFGIANAGGAPTFTVYKRLDTLADLAQPAISEIGGGQYYFEVDWAAVLATSITFKATLAGIELSDVISSPSGSVLGTATATAAVSSTSGYETVGPLVAKALTQAGLVSLNPAQIAAYDPFASSDPLALQALSLLDSLGRELASEIKAHLQRELTLTTAGAATSYALPADYVEMVDDTLWNNSGVYPLSGPITPQEERFLVAWNGVTTVRIPFRILGNRMAFPVAPGNGLNLSGLYISRNWIQTAGSGSGPDADHATARTDYVLFDPELVVLGLKFKIVTAKKMDNAIELAEFTRRREWAKGVVSGARALSLNGRGTDGFRLIDNYNLPVTGWGLA